MKDVNIAFWDTEIEISKSNVRIFPLSKGSKISNFRFEKFWRSENRVLTKEENFHEFCNSAVKVVSFLSDECNNYNQNYLERLILCNNEINVLGGELCLFVNSHSDLIHDFLHDSKTLFNIGNDLDFSVAKSFGVFDVDHQAWNKISGVSEMGPFPSIFVVNKNSEIVYSHIDFTFDKPFSFLEIAVSVYHERQKRFWNDENVFKTRSF